MGQTFVVATNEGDIATSLIANWNNAAWSSDNGTGENVLFWSETIRDQVFIKDLDVVLYEDGSNTVASRVLYVKRSNVTTEDLRINNRTNREVLQLVVTNRVAYYRDYGGIVEGARVNETNYGWNHGLGVSIYHERSTALHCRRGIDNHRSTDIHLECCILPTGWGAHYGWRMGSSGGSLGCTGVNNTVLNLAGGDFYCHDAVVHMEGTLFGSGGSAVYPTFIKARPDYWEFAGKIESRGCRIIVTDGVSLAHLIDMKGPAGGYNTSRETEMPRQIKISAQITMLVTQTNSSI